MARSADNLIMNEVSNLSTRAARRINVAHFIGSLHVGGAENQVALLANAMDSSVYNRHVIVMHDVKDGFRSCLHPDVEYYDIAYRKRHAPAALYRLYRYLVRNRIDILHCHMYHATVRGALVGRLASVPVIVTSEHGMNTWKHWRHHAVEKYIVNPLVAKRIAVSEDIRRIRIRDDGVDPEKITVLANAVNTQVAVKDNGPVPRVLGALGRLIDAKDYPVLIRAVAQLVSEGRDIELRIAGEGEERPRLEKLIAELDLGGVVRLMGTRPGQEFMSGIDVFVMSSKREGVPVSLLEAMARGLPVAATAVGGIPEILQDKQEGLLSTAGDPAALAASIDAIMQNAPLRKELGHNAREKVIRCYGVSSLVDTWSDLYRRMLAGKGKR